jgi:simple sugar transport system permease protein
MNAFSLALIPTALVSWFVLKKTVFGLRLRSVGENPESADTLGVNVTLMRYAGVLISGLMCGLAAAVLYPSRWVSGMTGGRGFIALAAVIFGRWDPIGAVLAAMLFGYADTARIMFEQKIPIPSQFVQMFPYVLAIVVLAGVVGKARGPAAAGKAYEKGED